MGMRITGEQAEAIAEKLGIDVKVKKKHKYGAKPTEVDGIKFPSTKQAKRYSELKLMEKAGEITGLKIEGDEECKFSLNAPSGERIGFYVADFVYLNKGSQCRTVEDSKGVRTSLYKWKSKHMRAQYGIEILET